VIFDQLCYACHGLSVLLTGRSGSGRPTVLFDVGPDGHLWLDNAAKLGVVPADIDVVSLSNWHADAHALGEGLFYASGFIARATSYETGLEGHVSIDATGAVHADPLIADERFLAAHVRGRGVSVVSTCSHAGIVNACLAAKAAFQGSRVDLVLGGYHLTGIAMERRTGSTVDDLHRCVNPRIVALGHCTGWRAKAALAGVGFDGYAPSSVGAYYHLQQES
jgi:7,8-dihydropterin-6-yl-methyl-4-(beta-D-ribofuranosyl)aminobenzene 5'-phosphate synthase